MVLKRNKILLTGVCLILIMTFAISANATSPNYNIDPDGKEYNNNPAYELVSNLNSTKIKTEKQMTSEIYEKTKDVKNLFIEKVKLTTYSKAMIEDILEEVGFVEDAKVYVLMDAETERVISVRTVGKVKDFKRP